MFFPLKDENPTERKPFLTVVLIAANVIVFIFSYFWGSFEEIVTTYGMIPENIVNGERLHTIFTSMFLHGGFLHLLGNVWFLWIFGDNIEDRFGRSKFLLIYFGSGLIAGLAHVAFNPASNVITIGASGAIAGVLGAYLVKYPRAKVVTLLFVFLFIQVVKIPSMVFLLVWMVLQFANAAITEVAGANVAVAYWAHIGGFLGGILMAYSLPERVSKTREKISKEYFDVR